MIIPELKKKLFDITNNNGMTLFNARILDGNFPIKYDYDDKDIEKFLNFAHENKIKIIYYDIIEFDSKEDGPTVSKEIGLAIHYNFNNELYRFRWYEDWFFKKIRKESEEEDVKKEEEEYEKIKLLREEYENLFSERFDEIEGTLGSIAEFIKLIAYKK